MAMTYDVMGNETGFDDSEEESKRKAEQDAIDKAHRHALKTVLSPVAPTQMEPTLDALAGQQPTNPLNRQPPAPQPGGMSLIENANAGQPTQPVRPVAPPPPPPPQPEPGLAAPAQQPPAQQPPVQPAPVQPAPAPQQQQPAPQTASALNLPGATPDDIYTAQQESGGQNVGKNPNSSAQGIFQITAPAFQDIQKADPYFQGRDQSTLTPEEQVRANQTYRSVLGGQLTQQGLEANDANLRAAHFAGAKGLADYLRDKTISPAAAKANGGAARVAHIIEQRLAGAPANEAGSQLPPSGVNGQHLEALNSGDRSKLLAVASDTTANPGAKKDAYEQLADSVNHEREMTKAQNTVDNNLANNNVNGLMREMNKKGDEGSYIKAYLYHRLGLEDLSRQEQQKLSPTLRSSALQLDGQNYHIKQNLDGEIVKAYDNEGNEVNDKTLSKLNANSYNPKNVQQHGQVYADPTGKNAGTFVLETRPGGSPVYKEISSGRIATPAEAATFKAQGVQGSLEYQQTQEQQKADIKLDSLRKSLALRLQGVPATEWNKETAKFNREFNANMSYMDNPYLKPDEIKNASAQTMPTAQAGAQTAMASNIQLQPRPQAGQVPVAPTPAPQTAPIAGGIAPIAPTAALPTAGMSPAQIKANQQTQAAAQKENALTPLIVNRKEQEDFIKGKDTINTNADNGRNTADITRSQVNNLLNTPEMMGYLTAGPGTTNGQIGKFIRETITGSYDSEESGKKFADKIRELSIPTALQSRIEEFKQGNQKINALTLKSNEGPGSISNFENKQNQAANMSNIGDLTPWSALTGLGRRQFVGDLTAAKQQYVSQHPELNTSTALESSWSKEADRMKKGYEGIYNARLKAVQPYYEQASKASNDERAQQAYRDAAIASFKSYPTPDYNVQTGRWEYKTKQAKLAAMTAIAGGQ